LGAALVERGQVTDRAGVEDLFAQVAEDEDGLPAQCCDRQGGRGVLVALAISALCPGAPSSRHRHGGECGLGRDLFGEVDAACAREANAGSISAR
jgi:hypothetical protein